MNDPIRICNSEDQQTTLEVRVAGDMAVSLKAIDPLWKTMLMAGLKGTYCLTVKRKINGVHAVVGVCIGDVNVEAYETISVKFQFVPAFAYQGCLSAKRGDVVAARGSVLKARLQDIAGHKWFNPDRPHQKASRTSHAPAPLVSVLPVLLSASEPAAPVPPTIPAAPTPMSAKAVDKPIEGGVKPAQSPSAPASSVSKPPSKVKGLADRLDEMKLIFGQIAELSRNRQIFSKVVSKLITEYAYGLDTKMSHVAGGLVIRICIKKGWFRLVRKERGGLILEITDKAIKEFELVIPSVPQYSAKAQSITSDLVSAGKQITELAPSVLKATDRLSAIAEQIAVLQKEKIALEEFLAKPECAVVRGVLMNLTGLTEVPRK